MRRASWDEIMEASENPQEVHHMRTRPLTVTVAAVLLAVLSLVNLLSPLFPSEGVPSFVIYLGIVLGIVGLIAAGGLWALKRWSVWLTTIVCALNILSAAPGIAFAPTPALRVGALFGVIVPALIILLVVLPNSRRAYT
jgi:hypothetical protein